MILLSMEDEIAAALIFVAKLNPSQSCLSQGMCWYVELLHMCVLVHCYFGVLELLCSFKVIISLFIISLI